MAVEGISTEQARRELGDDGYFAFTKWLREKGYQNLTKIGESKYKHEIFATKDQLAEFIRDVHQSFKGDVPFGKLWGQTREHLRRVKSRRSRINK